MLPTKTPLMLCISKLSRNQAIHMKHRNPSSYECSAQTFSWFAQNSTQKWKCGHSAQCQQRVTDKGSVALLCEFTGLGETGTQTGSAGPSQTDGRLSRRRLWAVAHTPHAETCQSHKSSENILSRIFKFSSSDTWTSLMTKAKHISSHMLFICDSKAEN